jgi:hypothetical protein
MMLCQSFFLALGLSLRYHWITFDPENRRAWPGAIPSPATLSPASEMSSFKSLRMDSPPWNAFVPTAQFFPRLEIDIAFDDICCTF